MTMTSSSPARHNGSKTPLPHNSDVTSYPTLKQSLSATSFHSPQAASNDRGGYFSIKNGGGPRSPRSNRDSPSLFVDIPIQTPVAQTALTALQYLPTPLLVLSSLKTVILANEAMARLLGLEAGEEGLDDVDGDGDEQETPAAAALYGQPLSQIGIDLLQDGYPVWVSWEVSHGALRDGCSC